MERESLLCLLIVLLGGLAAQSLAWWRWTDRPHATATAAERERAAWVRLWCPIVPLFLLAAGLAGWALREPDPVPDPLDPWVVAALAAPFVLLFLRAAVRAVWALVRSPPDGGVSTIGLLRPQVVIAPYLARELDERVLRAALAHEHAHARHRDPLRIWLALLATDLQWPCLQARRRLEIWLDALELARDEQARADGIEGADLAAAVLAAVRFATHAAPSRLTGLDSTQVAHARLTGDARALRRRVSSLLAPLPPAARELRVSRLERSTLLLLCALLGALVLGVLCGESIVRPLLALTSP